MSSSKPSLSVKDFDDLHRRALQIASHGTPSVNTASEGTFPHGSETKEPNDSEVESADNAEHVHIADSDVDREGSVLSPTSQAPVELSGSSSVGSFYRQRPNRTLNVCWTCLEEGQATLMKSFRLSVAEAKERRLKDPDWWLNCCLTFNPAITSTPSVSCPHASSLDPATYVDVVKQWCSREITLPDPQTRMKKSTV